MQARVLAENDLDAFNDYLFLGAVTGEAQVIADAQARARAENDASHKKAAQQSIGK